MKVYISGPISGRRREDYLAAFAERERWLREQGHDAICNPCRLAPCRFPWLYKVIGYRLTLLYDLYHLMRCTHITMLPGWQ